MERCPHCATLRRTDDRACPHCGVVPAPDARTLLAATLLGLALSGCPSPRAEPPYGISTMHSGTGQTADTGDTDDP